MAKPLDAIPQGAVIAILILLSVLAIVVTELRVADRLSTSQAGYAVLGIGIIHLAAALAVAIRSRSAAWYTYVAVTLLGFIGLGGVTPLAAVWSLMHLLFGY